MIGAQRRRLMRLEDEEAVSIGFYAMAMFFYQPPYLQEVTGAHRRPGRVKEEVRTRG